MVDFAKRVEMFMAKVTPEPNSGCWLWAGSANRQGYGNFWHGGKCLKAHRFSYMAFVGAIPDGLDIMHRCDVTSCVNPGHLRPGSARENMRDMWAKGRGNPPIGERNTTARLTAAQVRGIRFLASLGRPGSVLGRQYGVSAATACRVVAGTIWRHV